MCSNTLLSPSHQKGKQTPSPHKLKWIKKFITLSLLQYEADTIRLAVWFFMPVAIIEDIILKCNQKEKWKCNNFLITINFSGLSSLIKYWVTSGKEPSFPSPLALLLKWHWWIYLAEGCKRKADGTLITQKPIPQTCPLQASLVRKRLANDSN